MSYASIAASTRDVALVARIQSATTTEAWNNPAVHESTFAEQVRVNSGAATNMVWPVCVASDVEAAYESALAGGNPDPGGDPAVITDGMILANVQAKWPPNPA